MVCKNIIILVKIHCIRDQLQFRKTNKLFNTVYFLLLTLFFDAIYVFSIHIEDDSYYLEHFIFKKSINFLKIYVYKNY